MRNDSGMPGTLFIAPAQESVQSIIVAGARGKRLIATKSANGSGGSQRSFPQKENSDSGKPAGLK